jgi:hypothetical protein
MTKQTGCNGRQNPLEEGYIYFDRSHAANATWI